MALRLITDATAEPIDVDDVKVSLRLPTTKYDYDVDLERKIKTARREAENKTCRNCLPQTWKLTLNDWCDTITIPRAPLTTASSNIVITYRNSTNGTSTLGSSVYTIDSDSEPGKIHLAYGQVWPQLYDIENPISIQFVAGYPLAANGTNTTPDGIKTWITMRTADLFENPQGMMDRPMQDSGHGFFDGLLDEYVLIEVNP